MWVCSQEYPKTSSFSWIFLCKNSSLIKATVSCSLHWSHYIVVNLSHITLTLNHFMMYICRWRRNCWVRKYCLRWKSPNARKFCFSLSLCFLSFFHFFSFSFFGQLRLLLHICGVWLTQTPQKILTKSPLVTNIWIIYFRRKVTWFTTA